MNNFSQSFYTWYKNAIRNKKYRWAIVLGSLAYLLSPIDISPDFIPIIGWIDDGIIATLLVTELSQMAAEFLKQRKQPITTDEANSLEEPVITVDAR
ncbi:MAG TPA: DUF1232 domain-containing protein [Leptolyngbyaceae cyanobacterium]